MTTPTAPTAARKVKWYDVELLGHDFELVIAKYPRTRLTQVRKRRLEGLGLTPTLVARTNRRRLASIFGPERAAKMIAGWPYFTLDELHYF